MTIQEAIEKAARNDVEAIKFLGYVVERAIKSEFGEVLKALTAGRISAELRLSKVDRSLSADRVLGRCEMADSLWNDLIQYVLDKDRLELPVKEEEAEERIGAEAPVPKQYGTV